VSDCAEWPPLPLDAWQETCATLHMWTQIVGKIRLALSPPINHWWHVPLYVTSRGLTTSPIPVGEQSLEMVFDFVDHNLWVQTSGGATKVLALISRSVADFYQELMAILRSLAIQVQIHAKPDEVPDPIPFAEDHEHAAYDPDAVHRFWQILVQTDLVFKAFRGRFLGKCSPVHFYWGSFDLAVTRFSGRLAPERPDADLITQEAYSHEVISHGFWPGGGPVSGPAFYSYTAPAPDGLSRATICPPAGFYSSELSEFLLMYEDVWSADSPQQALMEFLQSTYEAGANLAGWDRLALER